MGSIHAAGEWLRLSEPYRGMTDGELIAIARDRSKLTEIAQQILAQELSQRNLKVEPEEQPTGLESTSRAAMAGSVARAMDSRKAGNSANAGNPGAAEPYATDPYAEDRELFEICTVWSLRDARQVQSMLDVAGIPFFMGKEKATGVDSVTSNFSSGVSVKIMRIGWPWARQALEHYEPKDVPEAEKQQWEWDEEVDVRCPSCRSQDILCVRPRMAGRWGSDEGMSVFLRVWPAFFTTLPV